MLRHRGRDYSARAPARSIPLLLLLSAAVAACSPPEAAPPPLGELSDRPRSEAFEAEYRERRRRVEVLEERGGSHQALSRAYGRLGLLLHAHREQQADLAYRHALHHQPGSATWLYYRADLAREDGDFEAARAHLDAALSHAPDDPWLVAARGSVELEAGAFDAAEPRFRRALELLRDARTETAAASDGAGTDEAWIVTQLGRIALLRERPAEAVALLEPLLEATEGSPEILQLLAQAYRLAGDEPASRAALQRAEGRSGPVPRHGPYRRRLNSALLDPRRFARVAEAAFSRADYPLAARAYRRALGLAPDRERYRFGEVAALAEGGDLEGAQVALDEWRRRDQERGGDGAQLRRILASAVLAEKHGDLDEAMGLLDQLLESAPTAWFLYPQRARIHLAAGDLLRAREDLRQVPASRRDAAHHRFAATLAVEAGDVEAACGHLDEARLGMIEPSPAEVALARLVAVHPGRCDGPSRSGFDPVRAATRAAALRPDDADRLETEALALAADGAWARAVARQGRALAAMQQAGVVAAELEAALRREARYRQRMLPQEPWTPDEWRRLRFVPGPPVETDDETADAPGGRES